MRALASALAVWSVCLAAGAAAAAPKAAETAGARQAVLARAKGTVLLLPKGAKHPKAAAAGTPLEPGDELRTGSDGTAEVLLEPDGIVVVRPGTVFRLPESAAPALGLDVGTALIRLMKGGPHSGLIVRTPAAVAALRGTEFAVEVSSAGGPTRVGVFDEGRVSVAGRGDGDAALGPVELGPRQETSCERGAAPLASGPLKVLLRHRAAVRALRARLTELRREYRDFPQDKRRELRQRLRGGPDDRQP